MSRYRWFVLVAMTTLLVCVPLARAETSVISVANDEIAGIEAKGFELPPYEIVALDRWNSAGNTVILPSAQQYVIVLWNHYYNEEQLRKVAAHEAAHLLMASLGLSQSEGTANQFVACFGSEGAKHWATQVENTRVSPQSCALLRSELGPNED
ncbi:MAG: hypothetical protein ACM3XM_19755 [Mycobacterium leprae]